MSERPGPPSFEPPAGTTPPQPPHAEKPFGEPYAQQPYTPQAYAQQTYAPQQTPQPWQAPVERQKATGAGKLVALVLAASLLGGGIGSVVTLNATDRPPTTTGEISTPVVQGNGDAVDWASVAEAVEPAVVSISVTTGQGGSDGSGVILDGQGNIATNDHVVSGGENGTINVTLNDNTIHGATIVGTDPGTDLAVIRLEDPPAGLTPIAFGDVSQLAVGDPVMAIGNPLGLSGSVTTGIVSALHRPVRSSASQQQEQSPFDPGQNQSSADTTVVTDAIQTSAPINPGNSGGALVNATGELVGLTSSIATLSGGQGTQSGNIGIGFAIRADQVRAVTTSLIETGTAVTPFLGVSTTDGIAEVNGASVIGANIEEVTTGSPAEAADLQPGDVVIAMDDVPITGSVSLAARVRSEQEGDEVTLEISRGGATEQVKVTLAGR